MKERLIIFSAEMVRAILAGRKTQTRRVIKLKDFGISNDPYLEYEWRDKRGTWSGANGNALLSRCPYGIHGDRLWVREKYFNSLHSDGYNADGSEIVHDCPAYAADYRYRCGKPAGLKPWKSPIFMPRHASRITLEITGVRVERVQSISDNDADAEGAPPIAPGYQGVMYSWEDKGKVMTSRDPVEWYKYLWDSINAKRGYSWDSNPWVWAVEFRKMEK